MGRVYLAKDRENRLVAVKVIREDLCDDPTFRARFEREIRAASSVEDRFVAGVLGSDLTAKVPYLATEFAAGPTLEQYVKENGPLDPAAVTQLAIGLAAGLSAIHRAGLVHRDLSPRNVVLAPDGPKIIDFGVARQSDATTITGTGASLGTPSWMAPEQVRGEEVGGAADIFAFGALLAYAASGTPPFEAARPEAAAYRIVHEDPTLSGISEKLLPIIEKALRRDSEARPSAHEFLESILEFSDSKSGDETIAAAFEAWPFQRPVLPKLTKRRRGPGVIAVAVALSVVLALTASVVSHFATSSTSPARALALAQASGAALRSGNTGLAMLLATEAEHIEPGASSDATLFNGLSGGQTTLVRELQGFTVPGTPIGFSSDGRLVAASAGRVRIWDARNGRPIAHQPLGADGRFADGSRLFVSKRQTGVSVWDLATGVEINRLPVSNRNWATSPGAPLLADDESDGTLVVWDLLTGRTVASIRAQRPLANLGWLHSSLILPAAAVPRGLPPVGEGVVVSADGKTVALVSHHGKYISMQAWRTETGRALGGGCHVSPARGPHVDDVVLLSADIMPDDATVRTVSVGEGGMANAISDRCDTRIGRSTSRQFAVSRTPPEDQSLVTTPQIAGISADQQVIATRNANTIQLVRSRDDATLGGVVRAVSSQNVDRQVGSVQFAPDGSSFAAGQIDGEIGIWHTTPEHLLAQSKTVELKAGTFFGSSNRIGFMSDGNAIDLATERTVAHIPGVGGKTETSGRGEPISRNGAHATESVPAASLDHLTVATLTGNVLTVVDLRSHKTATQNVNLVCSSQDSRSFAVSRRLAVVACARASRGEIQVIDIGSHPFRVAPPVPVGGRSDHAGVSDDAFSLNGHALAVYVGRDDEEDGVQLFAVHGTRLQPSPPQYEAISSSDVEMKVALSPNGDSYALSRSDGLLELGSTSDPRAAPKVLAPAGSDVSSVLGVSLDGRLLATERPDHQVELWDLGSEQLVGTVSTGAGSTPSPDVDMEVFGFGSTELTVATALPPVRVRAEDQVPRFLLSSINLDRRSWERLACTIANRNLTRVEWAQYLPGTAYRRTCPGLP